MDQPTVPPGDADPSATPRDRNRRVAALLATVIAAVILGLVGATAGSLVALNRARQANEARDDATKQAGIARASEAEARGAHDDATKQAAIARTARDDATNQATIARTNEASAVAQAELANQRLYDVRMNLAQHAWDDWNHELFHRILREQLPESQGGVDRRGFEWYYWQRRVAMGHSTLKGHTRDVVGVAFSPDGRRIASASWDGTVKVWDAATSDGPNNETSSGTPGETPYLILDARYENVRHGGQVRSCAVLVAVGIDPQGRRSILGVSVSLSEAEAHWRAFLASLAGRGLHGVKLVVADDHAGLKEALAARLTGVPRQRCQFHLVKNAMAFVPRPSMRKEVVASLRAVFDAPDRAEAERQLDIAVKRHRAKAPKLAEWLEQNAPEGLAVFALPASHRRRLRTINMLERLNKELKRRTRVAGLFPNETSALRLVRAVAMEISEEWETNRKYLTMEPD